MRCCVLCGIVMILITFRYISRSAPYPDAPPPPHARLAWLKAPTHRHRLQNTVSLACLVIMGLSAHAQVEGNQKRLRYGADPLDRDVSLERHVRQRRVARRRRVRRRRVGRDIR